MKKALFKRSGIFFFPSSISGWIILTAAIVYLIYLFIDIDSRSHSVSDTLMNFTFNLLIVSVAYTLIALFTSRQKL